MTAVNLKSIKINDLNLPNKDIDFTSDNISEKTIAYTIEWQRSKKRSGSAKIKQMHEISGTTAKPYKQKGTGNARQGSKRSVQFVGGRTCFGPTPRVFGFSLPKKIVKKALSDALKLKFIDNNVLALDFSDKSLKTTQVSKILKEKKIDSALFVYNSEDKESSKSIVNSTRNIKNIKSLDIKAINVYDLIKYNSLILDQSLLDNIKKIIS